MKLREVFDDPRGAYFKFADSWYLKLIGTLSTIYMKWQMLCRGVQYGKACTFYGKTYFRRNFQSTLIIGDSCRFRSSFISNNVGLNRPCFISSLRKSSKIIIGNNVGMSGTVIGCAESITIGNNVLLGGNTFITDFDWHSLKDRTQLAPAKPVVIEDDVFIGLNSIILKGSYIGKGSIIGANSVVSGYIPEGVIAAGNPVKVIKQIEE